MELSELTPELFETKEFTERRRGYDIDQVERFLEEAGTALVQLLSLYRKLEERATRAEARAVELEKSLTAASAAAKAAPVVSEEDEIERATSTLVMARKTADATVAEARDRAQTLVVDAETSSQTMIAEGRQRAEAEYATAKGRAIQEVAELESRRNDLHSAVTDIESRLEGYRAQLTGVAASLVSMVEDPTSLGSTESTAVEAAESVFEAEAGEPESVEPESVEPESVEPESVEPESAAVIEVDVVEEGVESPEVSVASESAATGDPTQAVEEVVREESSDPDAAWGEGGGTVDFANESDAGSGGSDKYLRELEDAVSEPPAGDDAMSAFFDSEEEPGRRFGWRR